MSRTALYKSIIIIIIITIIIITLQKIKNSAVFVNSRISSTAEFRKNISQPSWYGLLVMYTGRAKKNPTIFERW